LPRSATSTHTEAMTEEHNQLRVALVARHAGHFDSSVPLGPASIAAALRAEPGLKGAHIELLESFPDETPKALADRLVATHPDVIGCSVYLWNREDLAGVARRARALLDGSIFFAGGPDASADPEGLLLDSGGPFDFVVNGEGEDACVGAMKALLDGEDLRSVPGLCFDASPTGSRCLVPNLEGLPSPWTVDLLAAKKRDGALWELSRGCPYGCTYCYEGRGDRRIRRFSDQRLTDELEAFYAMEVGEVFVLDPVFTVDRDRAIRLLDLLINRAERANARGERSIHWHFEARAEHLDRGLADRFARLDASLQIGLQTSDPAVAKAIGRDFSAHTFSSKISVLNEAGVVFGLDLIYGLPGDSYGGFLRSLDYALSLYPNHLDLFPLAVLPGTQLRDDAPSLGLQWSREPPYLVQSSPSFPVEDMGKAAALARAADEFYNRGRAVPWFNQVLFPLGLRGGEFLERYAQFVKDATPLGREAQNRKGVDPVRVERLQLAFLDSLFEMERLDHLLPAVWDFVRFHGAWARAIAEGTATTIDFTYDPEEVAASTGNDLDSFLSYATPVGRRARVEPDGDGTPVLVTLGR